LLLSRVREFDFKRRALGAQLQHFQSGVLQANFILVGFHQQRLFFLFFFFFRDGAVHAAPNAAASNAFMYARGPLRPNASGSCCIGGGGGGCCGCSWRGHRRQVRKLRGDPALVQAHPRRLLEQTRH
jgi:hypothetical protein